MVVVLSPGVERFGCFEQLAAIGRGEAECATLLPEQDRYDVHVVDLPDRRSTASQRVCPPVRAERVACKDARSCSRSASALPGSAVKTSITGPGLPGSG